LLVRINSITFDISKTKTMITINISEETETYTDMAYTLRNIADSLERGNTSGYNPNWEVIIQPEKPVIKKMKKNTTNKIKYLWQ